MHEVDLHQVIGIEKIKKLTEDMITKRERYRILGMVGVAQDFDKWLEQSVEYEQAGEEYFEAEKRLASARRSS